MMDETTHEMVVVSQQRPCIVMTGRLSYIVCMYSDDADSDCDGIHEARMQRLVFDSPNAEQLDNNDLLKDV